LEETETELKEEGKKYRGRITDLVGVRFSGGGR
jgi:hypothetical protein